MPEEYEKAIISCGSMAEVHSASDKVPNLRDKVSNSLAPCVTLLNDLFQRAQWKDSKHDTFFAASEFEVEEFWKVLLDIDASIESCSYTKKTIKSKEDMLHFISHCCQQRHYSFCVKNVFQNPVAFVSPLVSLLKCIRLCTIYQIPCCLTVKMAITNHLTMCMESQLQRRTDLQSRKGKRMVLVVSL